MKAYELSMYNKNIKSKRMGAPKGNDFWKRRKHNGKKRTFETPEALWEAACNYFEWAASRSYKQTKEKHSCSDIIETIEIEKPIPFSITGFCLFIGNSFCWWRKQRNRYNKANEKEFSQVICRIEEVIETQQFEGACVGALNASIIARKLGLADKQEVDHTNAGKEFKGFNFLPYTPQNGKEDET